MVCNFIFDWVTLKTPNKLAPLPFISLLKVAISLASACITIQIIPVITSKINCPMAPFVLSNILKYVKNRSGIIPMKILMISYRDLRSNLCEKRLFLQL